MNEQESKNHGKVPFLQEVGNQQIVYKIIKASSSIEDQRTSSEKKTLKK
jgi:hypothetical protein